MANNERIKLPILMPFTCLIHDSYSFPFARTHLYAILGQFRLQGQHLAGIDIGIMGLLEGLFELLQLIAGEYGAAVSSLLLLLLAIRPYTEANACTNPNSNTKAVQSIHAKVFGSQRTCIR